MELKTRIQQRLQTFSETDLRIAWARTQLDASCLGVRSAVDC